LGHCISAVFDDADKWQTMVPRLKVAQAHFALAGDALVAVLRKLLEHGDVSEQKTSELYAEVGHVAGQLGLDFQLPMNAAAFTTRINEIQDGLEAMLDVKIATRTLHGHTLIRVTRGASWAS